MMGDLSTVNESRNEYYAPNEVVIAQHITGDKIYNTESKVFSTDGELKS